MFSSLVVKEKTQFLSLVGTEVLITLWWYMDWLCALVKATHFLAKEIQLWLVELPFTALPVHPLPKAPTLRSAVCSELGC